MTTKQRLYLLDGLRGICAALVALRHEVPLWGFEVFFRSYLAVDLFFIMSGYVIAVNYHEALVSKRISIHRFMAVRLIRFLPVYWLSILLILGLSWLKIVPGMATTASWSDVLREALLIPSLTTEKSLFRLNGVAWTLFFELLMNFAYAVVAQRGNRVVRYAITLAFGLIVVRMCLWYGTADRGASVSGFLIGLARSGFGIFIGAYLVTSPLVSRIYPERSMLLPWFAAATALGTLVLPSWGGRWDGPIDALLIVFVLPLTILAMTRHKASGVTASVLQGLGAASYPLYLLHGPIAAAAFSIWKSYFPSMWLAGIFSLLLFLLCWQIDKSFDEPIRKYLKSALLRPKQTTEYVTQGQEQQ